MTPLQAALIRLDRPSLAVGTATTLCYLHACPVCGSSRCRHYVRVASLWNAREYITYERCDQCDVVFRNPRLPDAERVHKYVEKPLEVQQPNKPLSRIHYHYMLRNVRRLQGKRPAGRLMDFGCGAGDFLIEARALGFDVMGLEVNRALARDVQAKTNIPVFCGLVDDPAFAQETFDVVVSSQVFEHLTDPRRTLLSVTRHLRSGGILLVEVPNLSHFKERLRRGSTMDDSHLFYFNRRSLCALLESAGLRVRLVQEGLRPFRWTSRLGRTLPAAGVNAVQQLASLCQLKTGLSIVATLDS